MRYAIFMHEPDGDSGDGCVVGPYKTAAAAEKKARAIEKQAERWGNYVECIVLPVAPSSISTRRVVAAVTTREA